MFLLCCVHDVVLLVIPDRITRRIINGESGMCHYCRGAASFNNQIKEEAAGAAPIIHGVEAVKKLL
jgi:hypothetical protein